MERINCTDYKLGVLAIKYIPIIMFLIMWIHTGLLIFGINGPCADVIAGSAIIPSILIFSMSNLFKFCYIHKLLTIYALAVDLCINFHRLIGFGYLVEEFRILMFIIGTILFFLLLLKCDFLFKYRIFIYNSSLFACRFMPCALYFCNLFVHSILLFAPKSQS